MWRYMLLLLTEQVVAMVSTAAHSKDVRWTHIDTLASNSSQLIVLPQGLYNLFLKNLIYNSVEIISDIWKHFKTICTWKDMYFNLQT